jgi:hypothetical protein
MRILCLTGTGSQSEGYNDGKLRFFTMPEGEIEPRTTVPDHDRNQICRR